MIRPRTLRYQPFAVRRASITLRYASGTSIVVSASLSLSKTLKKNCAAERRHGPQRQPKISEIY
jgi:hypothetical protein